MDNSEIAAIFRDIADLLEKKKENRFKILAYRKAAGSIESLPIPVGQLVAEDRLKAVPGIGEAINKKVAELLNTGRLEFYEKLKLELTEEAGSSKQVPR
jgi:DNA polymerase (family 10)